MTAEPGVYLFRDAGSRVIYVGKAASLRQRLRGYTPGPATPAKPATIVEQAADLETIVTRSEVEALMLEHTLIQKHRPRFNVIWRDNKSYPLVEMTAADEFPRVYIVRRNRRPGSRYFGPFTARTARHLIRMINRQFRLPSCRVPLDGKQTPCLYHHLGWCDAPCAGLVAADRYAGYVRHVRMILEGRRAELATELEKDMNAAAEREEFEEAARLRDRLGAIKEVLEDQAVVSPDAGDADVLGCARSGSFACLALLSVRSGRLSGKEDFVVRGVRDEDDGSLLSTFTVQRYLGTGPGEGGTGIPPRLLVPSPLEDGEAVASLLAERSGGRVQVESPKRGYGRELLDLANANARAALLTQGRVDEEEAREQLEAAAATLDLPRPPERVEAVDLSRLGGDEAVGAVAVFRMGQPANREHRRFLIKEAAGADDYACMREVVKRRLDGLRKEGETPPDLLLLDGGPGHLHAVTGLLAGMEAPVPRVAALAKREEILHLGWVDGPVRLPQDDPVLLMLMRMRDEAHRFANAYQRKRRSMAMRKDAESAHERPRATAGGKAGR